MNTEWPGMGTYKIIVKLVNSGASVYYNSKHEHAKFNIYFWRVCACAIIYIKLFLSFART